MSDRVRIGLIPPQKEPLVHERCGTWRSPERRELTSVTMSDEPARLADD